MADKNHGTKSSIQRAPARIEDSRSIVFHLVIMMFSLIVITAVGSYAPATEQSVKSLPQAKEDSPISFDMEAAKLLIEWARGDSIVPPVTWRSKRAYALTRQWAQWNAQPDSDLYVEQFLKEVAEGKSKKTSSPRMIQAQTLLAELSNKQQIFLGRAIPHLRSYLPPNTPIKGKIFLAVFIPPYAFSWGDGSIVIDLAADFWKGNADKLFNLLVHELYHNGYGVYQRGVSANEARNPDTLIDHLLWQTQNEGMATYVAYRAKSVDLTIEDYQLLDNPVEVRARFGLLQELISESATADEEKLPKIREKIWKVGNMRRVFYVVGACMARRIEDQKDRNVLVKTIESGPKAFLAAYAATSPPPDLRIVIK